MKRALFSAAAIAVLVGLAGCHCGLGGACGVAGCDTCAAAPEACQSCGQVSPACNVCAAGPGPACEKCSLHVNKMACRKGHLGHRAPMQLGPPMGSITYPYYTVKGPSDFLATETRPLGP